MKVGTEEWKVWCKGVDVIFAWLDHYYNEFGESPHLKVNRAIHFQNKPVVPRRHNRGYPQLGG